MYKRILLAISIAICFCAKAQLPMIPKGKAHIYLLAGQSNMAGRGTPEAVDTTTDPHIWMFTKDERWVPAKEPLAFDKPKVVGVGPGFAFARAMQVWDTTVTILLVPCAVGGTRIDLWKPGAYDSVTNTHPYDDALRRLKAALPAGEFKGILWHQGESDANPRLSGSYEKKLQELVTRFRADLGASEVPFIMGEISNFKMFGNLDKEVINAAIRNVARKTPLTGVASMAGLQHRGDSIHYDTPSARLLGYRYAELMKSLIK